MLVIALAMVASQCLVLFPAFPVLIASTLLPPRTFSVRRRALIFGGVATWVALLGLSIQAKNSAYLENFRKESNEEKRKRQEEYEAYERFKPVPPDPKRGPQKETEWRYLGATAKYNKTNGELESLDWDGGGIGSPFPPEAVQSLKYVRSLKSLTLRGRCGTDANLLNVKHLQRLEHLSLIYTKVTDAGLREIKGVPGLQSIYVLEGPITNESLTTFFDFPQLQTVEAVRTGITWEGWCTFKKQHANDPRSKGRDLQINIRRH
jgi:hypothetical protein